MASKNSDPISFTWEIANRVSPELFEFFSSLAKKHEITILAGSSPVQTQKGIVNRAGLFFPDGHTFFQDKLHLTAEEIAYGWIAGDTLNFIDTPWGRTSILICYDSEFPDISALVARAAPELILVPSLTGGHGLERVRRSVSARAIEHHAYVVMTGAFDPTDLANLSSHSAAFGPSDQGFLPTLFEAERNVSGVGQLTLDLNHLRRSRETTDFWPGKEIGR